MQIGRSQLSPEEREYCVEARECLYCGKLGHRIASCPVSPKDPATLNNRVFAAPVKLIASSNHNEAFSFFTFPSPDTLLILGFPWLQKHTPHTDWARKKIASCSSFCLANCPPGLSFVPNAARGAVIHWAYAAQFLCHPNVSRTITLLRRHFWWRLLHKDVKEYVSTCSTFACKKSSTKHPSGLLHPLTTPHQPWSHITLDFVTGLPSSSGKSVILTIADRFSKAAHFIALEKLPTTSETAQNLVDNVFRLHGIPLETLWPGTPVHLTSMEDFLSCPRCQS